MSIQLGLLGKDISHSKSEEIYKSILGEKVQYTLFDYPKNDLIPSLSYFFDMVDGLSITAPYKMHFLNSLNLSPAAKDLQAVNCIKKEKEKFFGFNTDYMAFLELIKRKELSNVNDFKIYLLGNGSMARVVERAFYELNIEYLKIFRKQNFEINDFNFHDDLKNNNAFFINACSRGVVIRPNIDIKRINCFWDLNYGQDQLYNDYLINKKYENGLDLLFLQAKFALDIWGIS